MRSLLVASLHPRAGKTAVAAALVQRFAYEGTRVLGLRLGGSGDEAASADARFYATLPGARGRGGSPLTPDSASVEAVRIAGDSLPVLEAPDGADVAALARQADAAAILVHHGLPDDDAVMALQNLALALEARFAGVVLTALPAYALVAAEQVMDDAALPLLAAVPEDRLLYSPTIGEIVDALGADLLLGDDGADDHVIEHLQIGPITADPGQPYYSRQGNKAVITRSDKTDLQLAALASNTDCLILTGGFAPSPYTLDRASNEEVALMVTRTDTRATVERLEAIFGRSRFGSERKLERMAELLGGSLDAGALTTVMAGREALTS